MADEGGGITSPEGVLMLCVAGLFDGLGFLIALIGTWFGIDDYGILDIFGGIIFGFWLFTRSGVGGLSGAFKKGFSKLLITFGIELIPVIGGVSPSWTIMVFRELSSPSGTTEIQEGEGGEKPMPQSVQPNTNSQPAKQESGTTAA